MKRNLLFIIMFAFALVSGAGPWAFADLLSSRGTAGASFLKLDLSARSASLSESYCALSEDLCSIQYNPAGIARINGIQAQLNTLNWYEGAAASGISLAVPLSSSCLAFNLKTLHAEDSVRAIENGQVAEKEKINLDDTSISFSYALRFAAGQNKSDDLFLGFTLKYITETLFSVQSVTEAGDIGFIYNSRDTNNSYSASLCNIGPDSGADLLPSILRLGAAYYSDNYKMLWELDQGIDSAMKISCGLDFDLMGKNKQPGDITSLFLRMGATYQSENLSYCGGFGLSIKSLLIDYAYVPHTGLDFISQRVTLTFKF